VLLPETRGLVIDLRARVDPNLIRVLVPYPQVQERVAVRDNKDVSCPALRGLISNEPRMSHAVIIGSEPRALIPPVVID